MDPAQFDDLLRSFSASPSRRAAVRLLAGLLLGSRVALGVAGSGAHDATLKCKKLDGERKKKCLKKAKKHNASHREPSGSQLAPCAPNCAGRNCGDDGCGGSCGTCTGGTCTGGTCACPSGQELCNGNCLPPCSPGFVRQPDCTCCQEAGTCFFAATCCSGCCTGTPVFAGECC